MNNAFKGKNICPLFAFILFVIILCTVTYIDSIDKDQPFGIVNS
jgi:hypothetical protein